MTVVARFRTSEGPAVGSVKGAEGYPAFTGVPTRLLTLCAVHKNGEYFVDGLVLLVGPGSRPAA